MKKSKAGDRTLKVRDAEHKHVNQLVLDGKYQNQADVIESALTALAQHGPRVSFATDASDPAITPQSDQEYRVISGLLAILREEAKRDPPSRGKRKGAA